MEAGDTGKEPAKPVDDEALKGSDASESAKAQAEPSATKTPPAAVKPTAGPGGWLQNRRNLIRVAVAALVVVGLVIWLATRDSGGGSSEPAPAEAGTPRIVTVTELQEAVAALGHPIYWAGPISGTELELNELSEGGPRVRYLSEGAEVGEGSAKSLTIGSYPLPDPAKSLQGYAAREGSIVRHAPDGREVVSSEERPASVYFVSPDNKVQVEVYDPTSPHRAMRLALSGRVRPAD